MGSEEKIGRRKREPKKRTGRYGGRVGKGHGGHGENGGEKEGRSESRASMTRWEDKVKIVSNMNKRLSTNNQPNGFDNDVKHDREYV